MITKNDQEVRIGSNHLLLDGAHKGKTCSIEEVVDASFSRDVKLVRVHIDGVGFRVYLPKILGVEIT